MIPFFLDSETATPITATIRNLWAGLNSSQATPSSSLNPMALAELASSAFTSRPRKDTQASRRDDVMVRVGVKWLERRRREEGDGIGGNGERVTNDEDGGTWAELGVEPGWWVQSVSSCSMKRKEKKQRAWLQGVCGFRTLWFNCVALNLLLFLWMVF